MIGLQLRSIDNGIKMTILDEIADYARERVKAAKENISFEEIKKQALSLPKGRFAFEKALKKDGISFICECKKASPSKGLIAHDFPYEKIANEYEAAGADGTWLIPLKYPQHWARGIIGDNHVKGHNCRQRCTVRPRTRTVFEKDSRSDRGTQDLCQAHRRSGPCH